MDPKQGDSAPVGPSDAGGTLYRAAHNDYSDSARDSAAAADPPAAAGATTYKIYKDTTETACLIQDVLILVGAGMCKIKREELEKASPAVGANIPRFLRTF
jgi:hypothetical protein